MTPPDWPDSSVEAIVFDMDGVLIESEHLWDQVRRGLARESDLDWPQEATRAMQGMSTPEWARYLTDEVGFAGSPEDVAREVISRMVSVYDSGLPLLPGAIESINRLAMRWPIGLASSSPRSLIDAVLDSADVAQCFQATLSTEEVSAGKPDPVVYQEVSRLLNVAPQRCVAIEDSSNGLISAKSAGMIVVAVPNQDYPPSGEALACADVVVNSLDDLTVDSVAALGSTA